MDSEELLEQLADIHLPTEISYWPPAPGWWILSILVVIGVIYLLKSYLAVSYTHLTLPTNREV